MLFFYAALSCPFVCELVHEKLLGLTRGHRPLMVLGERLLLVPECKSSCNVEGATVREETASSAHVTWALFVYIGSTVRIDELENENHAPIC